MNSVLNIIQQLLSYSPIQGTTENPSQRNFDWTRKVYNISINNPLSDQKVIAPGASFTIFNQLESNPLDNTSVLSIAIINPTSSIYRLSVTAGTSGFRTARSLSNITAAVVAVNNNALATFDFTGATLSGVVVGDIMRISGVATYEDPPHAFNPLNSGIWVIVAVSGTKVTCVRQVGQPFSGVAESIAINPSDVKIYSSSGLQIGSKMSINGGFSFVSQKTYVIQDVTPTTIDFVSTDYIPEESSIAYATNNITFYTNTKRLIYIEADQKCVVRFNADSSDNNIIEPIVAGDSGLVGYLHKFGSTYACTIINKSVMPLNLKYFTAE